MAGDFAKVYDEEIWSIYGFIAYRVRSVADAEDLTQCTFERALKSWKRFEPKRAPARVWLLAIARNLLIDHYRAADSRSERSLGEVDEEDLGGVPAEPDLGIDPELAEALGALSQRDREIVALRFGGDLTGLTLANGQQILSRSLRRLRAELGLPRPPPRVACLPQAPARARKGTARAGPSDRQAPLAHRASAKYWVRSAASPIQAAWASFCRWWLQ